MDRYYYTIAQLPMLFFDRTPDIDSEMFLEEAEKWLTPRDYAVLSQAGYATMQPIKRGPGVLKRYIEFERSFRTELVQWRRAEREGQEYKPRSFPETLVKEGNPLEIERKMLRYRWDMITELEWDHHFDLDFLVLYYIKLQILERLSLFDKEKGLELFQKISKVSV
mgnify:CR=1 FL=1